MIRLNHLVTAFLAVALCGVALESELPQRMAARLGFTPEFLQPSRSVDIVAADLQSLYPTRHADVVMLGDSLTAEAEWQELLPGHNVVNRGVAGQTTIEILARAEDVRRLQPRVVFVMAGINDLAQGRSPDQIASAYASILDRLAGGDAVIVVQTVLHVARDRNSLGLQRFRGNRRNDKIAEVNDRLRAMAAKRGLALLDLNRILAPQGVLPDDVTIDGTHLRAPAYLLWAKAVEQELQRIDLGEQGGQAATEAHPGRT